MCTYLVVCGEGGGGGYNVPCSLGCVEEMGIHNWGGGKDLPKSRGGGDVNIF